MNKSKWVYEGKPVHCKDCGYEPSYSLNKENSNYCPCCGAKMHEPLSGKKVKEHLIEYLTDIKVNANDMLQNTPSWDRVFRSKCNERVRFVNELLRHLSTIDVEE